MYIFADDLSQKYLIWTQMAEVKKKSPPKLYIVAAISARTGLSVACLKTNVPEKYIEAPSRANTSTKTPLESYLQLSMQYLSFWQNVFDSFQICATMIRKEPPMKRSIPSSNLPIFGMKQADPSRQRREPQTLMKKLTVKLRQRQSEYTQWSHQVMSASRNVAEPMVQSHPETSAASRQSLKKGKSNNEPMRKVPPPIKQLNPCQRRHLLVLSAVDFGGSINYNCKQCDYNK